MKNLSIQSIRIIITTFMIFMTLKEAGPFTMLSFFFIYIYMEVLQKPRPDQRPKHYLRSNVLYADKVSYFLQNCSEGKCPSCGQVNPIEIITEENKIFHFGYISICPCGYKVTLQGEISK